MKNILKIVFIAFLLFFLSGCAKEFLHKKPDKALVVPKTLKDLQSLLDNTEVINLTNTLLHLADGDFKVDDSGLIGLREVIRNTYLWREDISEGDPMFDWNMMYEQIFYANVVLDGLDNMNRSVKNADEFDRVKGSALFTRAHALSQLVQQFTEPYDKETASTELGVPIRTKSDVNIKSKRASLEETYVQIFKDLNEAFPLLHINKSKKFQPTRVATHALRARVNLLMGNYNEAFKDANAALAIQDDLIDYNDLDPNLRFSFPNGNKEHNKEVIYYANMGALLFYNYNTVSVSPDLLSLYDESDLRKKIFYNDIGGFKGSYAGSTANIFTGLSTAEMYLIRAECFAREEKISEAMTDLNTLREKRWRQEIAFIPYTASSERDALTNVFIERRKELVARGLRWSDLRRLNKDPRFQVTLERTFEGDVYQLLPNSERYVFLIGPDEINRSGIEQNNR